MPAGDKRFRRVHEVRARPSRTIHLLRGHRSYSYTPCVWANFEQADEDPGNTGNVIAFYTGRPIPKSRRDRSGSERGAWNREHIRSTSKGFPSRSQDAHTDAHHIRAADKSVDTDRSNHDFANGGQTYGRRTKKERKILARTGKHGLLSEGLIVSSFWLQCPI